MNTTQAFSDSINCGSLLSGLVSVQLTNGKSCDFLADTNSVAAGNSLSQTVQCKKSKKATAESLVAVNNVRKKCDENSASGERKSDAEEVQDSASTEFQSDIRNVPQSSESYNKRKEGERYISYCIGKNCNA
jgi:hypothetical protein